MLRQVDFIQITNQMETDLKQLALSGAPEEVCGIIHKHSIVHQYRNTFAGDRCHGFDMEVSLCDADDIWAIWHSHPAGPVGPSSDDIQCMEQLSSHGYSFVWVIVTPKLVTQWILDPAYLLTNL